MYFDESSVRILIGQHPLATRLFAITLDMIGKYAVLDSHAGATGASSALLAPVTMSCSETTRSTRISRTGTRASPRTYRGSLTSLSNGARREESYDWLARYNDVADLIAQYVPKSSRLLIVHHLYLLIAIRSHLLA